MQRTGHYLAAHGPYSKLQLAAPLRTGLLACSVTRCRAGQRACRERERERGGTQPGRKKTRTSLAVLTSVPVVGVGRPQVFKIHDVECVWASRASHRIALQLLCFFASVLLCFFASVAYCTFFFSRGPIVSVACRI